MLKSAADTPLQFTHVFRCSMGNIMCPLNASYSIVAMKAATFTLKTNICIVIHTQIALNVLWLYSKNLVLYSPSKKTESIEFFHKI